MLQLEKSLRNEERGNFEKSLRSAAGQDGVDVFGQQPARVPVGREDDAPRLDGPSRGLQRPVTFAVRLW